VTASFPWNYFLHPEDPTIQQISKISMDISAGENRQIFQLLFILELDCGGRDIKLKKKMPAWMDYICFRNRFSIAQITAKGN
jgi:hypothetical protein